MEADEQTYGKQIVAARHKMGIQQKDLAARVGISTQHLCDVEHDRRGVSVAVAAAIVDHVGVRYETPGERSLRMKYTDLLIQFNTLTDELSQTKRREREYYEALNDIWNMAESRTTCPSCGGRVEGSPETDYDMVHHDNCPIGIAIDALCGRKR
jgi:transcriptional regulator with XRE-family HTH domain